jgi:hypothetical protein
VGGVAAAAPRLTLMEGSWLEVLDSDGRDKMAVEAEEKNEDTGIRFFLCVPVRANEVFRILFF